VTDSSKNKIKRSKRKFDPVVETRDWSAAVNEEYCKRIAKNTNRRVVEVIDTEDELLPVICIFEGITYD
jgi:hypothetical protein